MRRILGPVFLATLLVTGCADGSESKEPYAADFKSAQKNMTSDFERTALEDRKITRAEYEEAVNRFVKCMRDHGVDAEASPNDAGFYGFSWTKIDRVDEIKGSCERGTTTLIEPLYVDMTRNPNKENTSDLLAKCFVRKSAAPPGYSGEDVEADMRSQFEHAPFSMKDPSVRSCLSNPSAP